MIIALDFKYEQRSPRPRFPLQRFLSTACINNLALLLIYSDLTQLSELTHLNGGKSLMKRVIYVFVTQKQ